ncbi:MAG: HAMP domain-containing sensor histidine kinase [Gammaproteobacteria bacterium]|nr:HAMP domain-containing sensor histidine kinase [Gammaproteobacteria bacterium]
MNDHVQETFPAGKRPLRRRLFRAMSALVVVTVLLAALSFYHFNQHLEDQMLDIIMSSEMAVIKEHLADNPNSVLPRASSMRVFLADEAPASLTQLTPGRHHDIRLGGDRYDVLVDEWQGEPIYLLFNINRIEGLEKLLFVMLGVMILMLVGVASLASLVIARRLVGPVDRLSRRLAELKPTDSDARLASEFANEDIEQIARAIDHYRERITGFVQREQSFTSAASHELRTPLSVIQGATELLLSDADKPQERRALARIERARRDMLEFIDALLSLSREDLDDADYRAETRIDEVLRKQCQQVREWLEDKPVDLACGKPSSLVVKAPPSLVAIALSNLLRNAVAHTRSGEIRVHMEGRAVTIEDTGDGIPAELAGRVFDQHVSGRGGSGMGLYIVKRICDRYGWEVSLSPRTEGGTRAEIRF